MLMGQLLQLLRETDEQEEINLQQRAFMVRFPFVSVSIHRNDRLIQVINGFFAQDDTWFDPRYEDLAKDLYQSGYQHLDFIGNETGSVQFINNWINNQTHGRIADIVSNISKDTILTIVNTLYFRDLWEEPFQLLATANHRFFPNGPDGPDAFDVPMMAKRHCMPYYHWTEENVRVVGVPYRHNVTMYIFMPINSTRELVQSLQSKLSTERINDIVTKMNMTLVTLLFPKMHISNTVSLKNVFRQLGVYTPFERQNAVLFRSLGRGVNWHDSMDILDVLDDTQANTERRLKQHNPDCIVIHKGGFDRRTCVRKDCLWGGQMCICCAKPGNDFRRRRRDVISGMMGSIFVSEMLHKIDLPLSERGTENGTVPTKLIDQTTSENNFIVNGPFVMVIREETTRLPLFYGNVYSPL